MILSSLIVDEKIPLETLMENITDFRGDWKVTIKLGFQLSTLNFFPDIS